MEDTKYDGIDMESAKAEHIAKYFVNDKTEDKVQARSAEKPQKRYEPKLLKRILNKGALLLFVLVVGGIGGIVADRWVIPYLVSMPVFSKYSWLERIKENTTVMNWTKEIKISEDLAMVDAISKVKSSVVKVIVSYNLEQKPKPWSKKPPTMVTTQETLNGVIVTSDGLVLVRPSGFIPPDVAKDKELKGVSYKVILSDKREFDVADANHIFSPIFQMTADNPLAKAIILKINATDLPVMPFGDNSGILLGDRVAVVGEGVAVGSIAKINPVMMGNKDVNSGKDLAGWTVLYFDHYITNKDFYSSSALINLKGEMVGLHVLNSDGTMSGSFVSIDDLKPFINSVMAKK